jgi:hypothetical protein
MPPSQAPLSLDGSSPEHEGGPSIRHGDRAGTTTDDAELRAFEAAAAADLLLPFDAHVIGEPVTVTKIRYAGVPRIGLLATCERGERAYEGSLADVVIPPGSAGARFVARYRTWLGFEAAAETARPIEPARPHKVGRDDLTVGEPVELLVLVCKSNALRCRLLGTTREVTLRTAVRDEIPGSIITVTPKKQWTHGRHPYLSGDVSAVRFDATVLGLVPLALRYQGEWEPERTLGGRPHGKRPMFQMEQVIPGAIDDLDSNPIFYDAKEREAAGDHAGARELLTNVLALDPRCLEGHAHLGDQAFRHWPSLALRHYELGVAIGSLTVGVAFDGVLPWGLLDNRPFLRCLHGTGRALFRLGQRDAAAAAFRRLLHVDPADDLRARESLAAVEAGKTWAEMEGVER